MARSGKIRARRQANRQNNHLMLAQQETPERHGKNLEPVYHAHLCSKLQYNYITSRAATDIGFLYPVVLAKIQSDIRRIIN